MKYYLVTGRREGFKMPMLVRRDRLSLYDVWNADEDFWACNLPQYVLSRSYGYFFMEILESEVEVFKLNVVYWKRILPPTRPQRRIVPPIALDMSRFITVSGTTATTGVYHLDDNGNIAVT